MHGTLPNPEFRAMAGSPLRVKRRHPRAFALDRHSHPGAQVFLDPSKHRLLGDAASTASIDQIDYAPELAHRLAIHRPALFDADGHFLRQNPRHYLKDFLGIARSNAVHNGVALDPPLLPQALKERLFNLRTGTNGPASGVSALSGLPKVRR
jgi:hypothetical protein